MTTNIQWAQNPDGSPGETWNPVVGCTRVSAGCDHCYAFALHDKRFAANGDAARAALMDPSALQLASRAEAIRGARTAGIKLPLPPQYDLPFSRVQLMPERLTKPFHWRKPRRVFVNSMSDLFHEDVPDEFIDQVFAVMEMTPQHTFMILTKRPERMRAYMAGMEDEEALKSVMIRAEDDAGWPLPNVWLGVSVENQETVDERIPLLLATSAAKRFISAEPLLSPIALPPYIPFADGQGYRAARGALGPMLGSPRLDLVIVGGESGPGARPCDIVWIRSIVRQCWVAGTACFVKQLGSHVISEPMAFGVGNSARVDGGHWRHKMSHPHGGSMDEWPEDLRIRQFPGGAA